MVSTSDELGTVAAARNSVRSPFAGPHECVHQALEFIYVAFRRLIPYDRIGLALIDHDAGMLRMEWQRTERPEHLLPANYSGLLSASSVSRVIADGKPRVLNDLVAYLMAHPGSTATEALVERGFLSSLTCPLIHGDRAFGVMFFSSYAIGTYSSGHVEAFISLADEVASILASPHEPAAFGATIGRLAIQLDRVQQEAHVIEQVTRRVHRGVTLDEVMNELYEALELLVPFEWIGLALIDPEGATVTTRWARSRASHVQLANGYSLELSSTSLGVVAASGTPRIIANLATYLTENPASASTRIMVNEGMRASLTCPLQSAGKTLGFVFFSSASPNAYQAAHVAVYQRLAAEVSLAVERSLDHDDRAREHQFSESLLAEFLPKPVLRSLRHRRGRVANYVADAGILFVDIQGFTSWSLRTAPEEMVGILDRLFRDFDRCCQGRSVHKLRTIGDAYMAVSGVVDRSPGHLEVLAEAALQMLDIASRTRDPLGRPVVVRAGVACGPVVAGVLGGQVPHYDVWGPCVNLASRLQAIAPGCRLCVDGATAARLGERFSLDPIGPQQVKGVGTLDVFMVGRRAIPLT